MAKYFTLMVIFGLFSTFAEAREDKRIIVGYIEKIDIPSVNLKLQAKLDTGATTTSIHAKVIETSENEADSNDDGDSADKSEGSVVFTIETDKGQTKNIKKPIVRWAKIKKKNGGTLRRPVVMMEFCISGQLVNEEVNLADRGHFNYDILIGRNMLKKGYLVVDASKTFTATPNCPAAQKN